MEENDFNLIEKYVCAACDPHNRVHMSHVNRLRFFWFKKSRENKLRKLPPKKRDFKASCFTFNLHWWLEWGVTSYPSDQIPSPVDWGWNYSKENRFAVDWCKAYDVNLNDIFTY